MTASEFLALNTGSRTVKRYLSWLLLPSRLVLFAFFQLVIGLALWAEAGRFDFQGAGIYWAFSALGGNILTILILRSVYRSEGLSFLDLYKFSRGTIARDLLVTVGLFVLIAPITYFPNVLLAGVLFADPTSTVPIMFATLPKAAAYVALLFPLTIGFAELPLYMGYLMPRVSAQLGSRVGGVLIAGFFLALQHTTLPLMFDPSFILWRFAMFLPLALVLATALNWRPRLLPYCMIGHALLDLSTVVILISRAS